MKAQDLTQQRFGRLIAISRAENTLSGRARWLCRCDCGNSKTVAAAELKKGGTSSCGCLALEQRKAAAQSQCHAYSRSQMYRERKSWENMMARCYDSCHHSYPDYGGRGIAVCDGWRESFKEFVSSMGRRPKGATLERIDNDANYAPDNCRWATRTEQANNRRTNRIITVGGDSLTVAQWSRKLGIDYRVIHSRLYLGWPETDAVMVPVGHRRSV